MPKHVVIIYRHTYNMDMVLLNKEVINVKNTMIF
jgi:hypothetical protein